jgi:hypothetical protein
MLIHLKRIYLVINELLANIDFDVFELLSSKASRLSQVFNDQSLLASLVGNNDDQLSLTSSITSNTSLSYRTKQGVFKKPKKRRAAEIRRK